jgi:transcription-repair coupling factor (superfamily II helicase)
MSLILSKFFNQGSPGKKLLDLLQGGCPEVYVSGIRGSASSFFISLLFDMFKRHFLVVAASIEEAQEMYDEFLFFRNRNSGPAHNACPEILLFPPLEIQPYENVLSHCDVSGQRLWTLYRLCDSAGPCIVITSVRAVLQKVLPADVLIDSSLTIKTGDELDRDRFSTGLVECGYTRVSMVEDKGDLSIRGEVMDIFPPGFQQPVRIDFFGDFIESIKLFDPATQRSCTDLKEASVVPVREIIMSRSIINDFQKRAETAPLCDLFQHAKGRTFLKNIQNGFLSSGVEYCLSFMYPGLETLFDYLPQDAVLLWGGQRETEEQISGFNAEVDTHFLAAVEERRVVSPPEELFIGRGGLQDLPIKLQQVFLEGWDIEKTESCRVSFSSRANEDIRRDMIRFDSQTGALSSLAERIEQWLSSGIQVFIICHTRSQCARLAELLSDYGLQSRISHDRPFPNIVSELHDERIEILTGKLSRGFRYAEGLLAVIAEEEIFGEKKRRVAGVRLKQGTAISDFSDLKEGNFIVHRDNGIGIYCGLDTLNAGGIRADYLKLQYLDGDKLYLPVDRINLINKYDRADDSLPRLDRLGGSSWTRVKKKVKESVEKIACDLIELYSARKVYKGHAFQATDHYFREFEASFPFEETPDQLAAIQDVITDMSHEMPMDRLICGDVGYGKTEVALRAAFRAVMEGKQAAVLVPTTVLAQQHYLTFSERFSAYPVCVEILSRFRSTRDQKRILGELAAGKVDIVVGTHRIVQKDVVFRDLGLLVIDEEHRFGVKHKEQVKKLKKTVDVMTLTATPIPRTLQFSLLGMRDFSIIETPPEDRLAIRTVITHFDDGVIRDAILRELKRGGQVFFVHDRVKSITAMAYFLKKLVPEMRLGVAHGQMKEKELESSMMQFVCREVDVLLCTTIIESGLDFPTANTIIIHNAHRLGLAQMYQLRGRVGRGKVRAYAYLLVPGKSILGRDAVKRLEALSEFTELGSGYRLATRDLQIRGAGNILGHSQSGHIDAVGMDMFLELLNDAVRELKGEKAAPKIDPEVNIKIQAYIPEDYVPDINQRLVLYRRMASAGEEDEVSDLEDELLDRFGKLPSQVEALLETARIRNLLREYLIVSVDYYDGQIVFTFHADAEASLDKIIALVESNSERFRFTPDLKLFAKHSKGEGTGVLQEIREILGP